MSDFQPAGYMNSAQRKLKIRLVGMLDRDKARRNATFKYVPFSDAKYEHIANMLDNINGSNPAAPTIRAKHMVDWKKRLRERLGVLPRILAVGEYGGKGGRPHNHAIALDVTSDQAHTMAMAWTLGSCWYEPIQSIDKLGTYISKDIVKSTWSKNQYISNGREAPFMTWPNGKGRAIAAGQENQIHAALLKAQQCLTPEAFEQAIQEQHVGKSFATHSTIPEDSLRAAMDGPNASRDISHETLFSKTAYKNALARITERDPDAQEVYRRKGIMDAHFNVVTTDEKSGFFTPEHAEHRDAKNKKAKHRLELAERNHANILERKRLGGRAPL